MNSLLTHLRLENYRGFREHTVPFSKLTIAVGKNNAGKSTIVEALRLVSIITSRIGGLGFVSPPGWAGVPLFERGVVPSLKNIDFNFDTIFHGYSEPPAVVEAKFSTGHLLRLYLNKGQIFATIRDSDGHIVTSKSAISRLKLPRVAVLPQIGPLAREERPLMADYVQRQAGSSLSSNHFRNQIWNNQDLFPAFQEAVERTWPGVRVRTIELGSNEKGEPVLRLWVQDGDFTGESSWMGHGLQMWLQTIWLLVRDSSVDCIVLDEPDVYMHPDLQRRLIRFLRYQESQIIVATHSTEILAEVNPEQILVIDRKKQRSEFATSLPAVQSVLEGVGSTHNINLTRLWNARRLLIVEGEDAKYLKRIHDILFPDSRLSLDALPTFVINGWGGWNYAVGSVSFLENSGGEGIVPYCILDSDYHTEDEIQERYTDAAKRGIQLHIWERKEVENYFISATAIQRIISNGCRKGDYPTVEEVETQIDFLVQTMRDEVMDGYASELSKKNRGWDVGTVNKRARESIEKRWVTRKERVSIVPGKRLLGMISDWTQSTYGISLSITAILRELSRNEIPIEMERVLTAIEHGEALMSVSEPS